MVRPYGQFIHFISLILLCGTLVTAGQTAAATRPVVSNVRAASHDGTTRFVLDLSDPVAFTVSVSGVNQVAVDLPDLDWPIETRNMTHAVGLVQDFHYGPAQPGTGRLLLQTVSGAVVQKAFLIPPAAGATYRLVIDLGLTTQPSAPPSPTPPTAQLLTPPPAQPRLTFGGNPIISPNLAAPNNHETGAPIASGQIPSATPTLLPPMAQPPAPPPSPKETAPTAETAFASPPAPPPPTSGDRKQGKNAKPIVVIDAGHGGVDPGALSVSGAYEKNIVLALAHDVKTQLEKTGKVRCVLTRDADIFIPLRDRIAIARANHADLFMSLHADTVSDPEIRGLSVYTLSKNASDAEAQALADKENKADIVAGIDLSNESPEVTNILIDLVQRESMNLSANFAHEIIREVHRETKELLQNTHRFAGFAVLKAPDVPSVLVESGYLSNPQDEQMLRRTEYRAKLASALARAIEHYFAQTRKARH